MTLPPESDPTFPRIKRKTEDNEVEVVKNSGINTKNLWLPNGDNPSEWEGDDILSKDIIWRSSFFSVQVIEAVNVIHAATGRDGFTFQNSLFIVAETEFAHPITMRTKIAQDVKASCLIAYKLFLDMSISV